MASPTRWTWVSVNSGSWWWTGRPGVLWSMGCKESDTTEWLNWTSVPWTPPCNYFKVSRWNAPALRAWARLPLYHWPADGSRGACNVQHCRKRGTKPPTLQSNCWGFSLPALRWCPCSLPGTHPRTTSPWAWLGILIPRGEDDSPSGSSSRRNCKLIWEGWHMEVCQVLSWKLSFWNLGIR